MAAAVQAPFSSTTTLLAMTAFDVGRRFDVAGDATARIRGATQADRGLG